MRRSIAVTAAASLALATAGLAAVLRPRPHDRTPVRPVVLDADAGSYRGAILRSRLDEVVARLGAPPKQWRPTRDPAGPLSVGNRWAEYGLPNFVPGGGPPYVLRYRRSSFLFDSRRLHTVITVEREAQTRRGVGVGDALALVRTRYAAAVCDSMSAGDRGEYPFCAVRLHARRHLWFGADPIRSITVSTRPLGGAALYERPAPG